MKKRTEPATGDLVSDIAAEIAAEEHRQGLAYGVTKDHCARCVPEWEAAERRRAVEERDRLLAELARKRDNCRHANIERNEMFSFGGEVVRYQLWCPDCQSSPTGCLHPRTWFNRDNEHTGRDICTMCGKFWVVVHTPFRVEEIR